LGQNFARNGAFVSLLHPETTHDVIIPFLCAAAKRTNVHLN
jgi:hypothetical protein